MSRRSVFGGLALGAVGVVSGYLTYLFAAYHRLPDDLPLPVRHVPEAPVAAVDTSYLLQSWNIGYGSYPPDYTFFMSGGKASRATSRAAVEAAIAGVANTTQAAAPDCALFQEVVTAGDRSWHVNEVTRLATAFADCEGVYGQNYDSPYLAYPSTHPIGAAKSGLLTASRFRIDSARRYRLPIETNLRKFLDLDRAFTASAIPVANGRTLWLINVHLSAFTKDRAVQAAQFATLFDWLSAAYAAGDYVIVGGDFNHRLLADAPAVFGTHEPDYTWTHVFPFDDLPAGFTVPTAGLAEAAVPSIRSMAEPYQPGHTFVSLIDGFIVSANVEVEAVQVVPAGFEFSDHNPVRLRFRLKGVPDDSTD